VEETQHQWKAGATDTRSDLPLRLAPKEAPTARWPTSLASDESSYHTYLSTLVYQNSDRILRRDQIS